MICGSVLAGTKKLDPGRGKEAGKALRLGECRDVRRYREARFSLATPRPLSLPLAICAAAPPPSVVAKQVDLVSERRVDRRRAALEWHVRCLDLGDLFEEIFSLNVRAAADAGGAEIDGLAFGRLDEVREIIGRIAWARHQRFRARRDDRDGLEVRRGKLLGASRKVSYDGEGCRRCPGPCSHRQTRARPGCRCNVAAGPVVSRPRCSGARRRSSTWPTMRARVSVMPPAAKATISVILPDG